MPELARGLLRETFAAQDDFEVVELLDGAPPPHDGWDAIVTVASAPRAAGLALSTLARPGVAEALMITIDGARVLMFEFRPRQHLIDPSPAALVAAIRDEVAQLRDEGR